MEFLENIGALDLGKSVKCQNCESSRSGEETVEFIGKTGKLGLGNFELVKSWRVRSVVSHSRVRDPLGFEREIN